MITLKNVPLNFPALFTLPTINGKVATKYSTKVILDPKQHATEIKAIQAEIERLRVEELKGAKLSSERFCLRNGDDLGKEEYEGKMVLSTSTKKRPVVVIAKAGELEPLTQDDDKIYSGCICNVNVTFWAQDNKEHGKRVNSELLAVQWKAEGTPLGGGGISREAAVAGFDLGEDDFG